MTAPNHSASALESIVGKLVGVDAASRTVRLLSVDGETEMAYAAQLAPSMHSLNGSRVVITLLPDAGSGRPLVVSIAPTGDDDFWRAPDLEELIAVQGARPIRSILDLKADFWPEGESVDDFLAAAMQGRGAYRE